MYHLNTYIIEHMITDKRESELPSATISVSKLS